MQKDFNEVRPQELVYFSFGEQYSAPRPGTPLTLFSTGLSAWISRRIETRISARQLYTKTYVRGFHWIPVPSVTTPSDTDSSVLAHYSSGTQDGTPGSPVERAPLMFRVVRDTFGGRSRGQRCLRASAEDGGSLYGKELKVVQPSTGGSGPELVYESHTTTTVKIKDHRRNVVPLRLFALENVSCRSGE